MLYKEYKSVTVDLPTYSGSDDYNFKNNVIHYLMDGWEIVSTVSYEGNRQPLCLFVLGRTQASGTIYG